VKSPEGQELAALCLDCGYRLAESPADLTRPQINFLMGALSERNHRIAEASAAAAEPSGGTRIIFTNDDDEPEDDDT
jgi:hypothetical protein